MEKIKKFIKTNSDILPVVLITALAIILRLVVLNNFGEMWYDELFTWFFASRESALGVVKISLEQDVHMPIFFILLHFWIKIFGEGTDAMRILSFLISIPIVPLGYYFAKKIFKNSNAGYFTAIYLSINTFCIYYSLEVRMYCLNLLLSLLLAFGFISMLEDFDKKSIALYITSLTLMLYNFTTSPMLGFLYFLVGLIYLILNNREKIKTFILAHFMVFILALPALYWTIRMFIEIHKTMIYYPLDIFRYHKFMIFDILENFFTKENVQIFTNNYFFYPNIMDKLHDIHYWVFIIIPVLIAMFGLIKALASKNKNLYLLFIPSFLFFVVMFVCAMFDKATLQTRYLTLIFPVVTMTFCYGLATFKSKISCWVIFSIFLYFNLFGAIGSERSVYNLYRGESNGLLSIIGHAVKLKTDDLLLIPMSGNKYMYYIKKGIYIPFCIDDALVIREKNSGRFYFGEKFDDLTRDTAKQHLLDDALNDTIHKPYEENLYNRYIKRMHKGQRIVFITTDVNFLVTLKDKGLTKESCDDFGIVDFMYSKVHRDSLLILEKYLKFREHHNINNMVFYIFEKE